MFWTPFTGTEIKPRMQVRDLPAFKDFKLQGAEVAAQKTTWGYTAEFKLPWANFPGFKPKAGDVIGIDCELCSSDGGPRVDRTFVYSSPAAVSSPSAFGRVQLVDSINLQEVRPYGRALLPLAFTQSANYAWLYGRVCISPTLKKSFNRLEGQLVDARGKRGRKASDETRRKMSETHMRLAKTRTPPNVRAWTAKRTLFSSLHPLVKSPRRQAVAWSQFGSAGVR
jgi:hypothetical protein